MQFFNPDFPGFIIKNEVEEQDIPVIHNYLTHSYWSKIFLLKRLQKQLITH